MILCSGAFDGIHAGHVRYLEAAQQLKESAEDLVIVAVAPDAYIVQSKQRQPYWNQADRIAAVQGLAAVDAAIVQPTESVASIILQFRPRLFVKGEDWENRLPEDVLNACTAAGTALAFVETPGTHVSEAHGRD